MADSHFTLLLTIGLLFAVHGAEKREAYGDVVQTTAGKKDLLSIILPPHLASTGAKASETGSKTGEVLDDVIAAIFDVAGTPSPENSSSEGNGLNGASVRITASEKGTNTNESLADIIEAVFDTKRPQYLESTPNSSSNGDFHSHQSGDFNAGGQSVKPKVPDAENGKVIKASGVFDGSHSSNKSGKLKGSSSHDVLSESNVYFPDEGDRKVPQVTHGAFNSNGGASNVFNENSSAVGGEGDRGIVNNSKEITNTTGKIEVEPYYIIGAPVRDDDHGCKSGQRWTFGHCRDILD